MFGLSFGELLIIAVVALILLGPERLPGAARALGKGLRELRQASEDLKDQLETEVRGDAPRMLPRSVISAMPLPGGDPASAPAERPPSAVANQDAPPHEAALREPAAPDAGLAEPPPGMRQA